MKAKARSLAIRLRQGIKRFFTAETEGIGVVEIVLIIVVIISFVIIFRDQIINLINGIFNQIQKALGDVYKTP